MRKKTKVKCNGCGIEFDKVSSEVKRNKKLGRNNYCSIQCSINTNGKSNLVYANKKRIELGINNGGFRGDEFTPFREFLRRAKRRNKLGDLTLQNIKEQWEYQKGVCPYTGLKLELKGGDKFRQASLDRKDSNRLYEKGNIEFVSTPINLMKGTMSVEETIEYIKIIKCTVY